VEGEWLLKVLIFGECVDKATGFGNQTRFLSNALSSAGHEVVVAGAGGVFTNGDVKQHFINHLDAKELDFLIEVESPDVCIVFSFLNDVLALSYSRHLVRKIPCFFWVAWESDVIPQEFRHTLDKWPSESIVHLTRHAKDLWGIGDNYIPHAVDTTLFKPTTDRKSLRESLSRRLGVPIHDDGILLLNVDRNDNRKRWDLTYDLLSRLRDRLGKRVQLIAHTSESSVEGYNHGLLMDLYDVRDLVIHTGCDRLTKAGWSPEEYADLFAMSDIRISTSSGEGFGIPTLEAYASGCVNIVPHNTCQPEVARGSTVRCGNRNFSRGLLWDDVDVGAMASVIENLVKSPSQMNLSVEEGLERINEEYSEERVAPMWEALLKNLPPTYPHDFPKGLRSDELLTQTINIVSSSFKEFGVPEATCIENGRLADGLRSIGHVVRDYVFSPRSIMSPSSQVLGSPDPPIAGKVSMFIDCFEEASEDVFEGLLNDLQTTSKILLRWETPHPSEGVSESRASHILCKLGWSRDLASEINILRRYNASDKSSNIADLCGIQVWGRCSRSPSNVI
jgi:glycosyltransferase involved in cell wall biosynthesis